MLWNEPIFVMLPRSNFESIYGMLVFSTGQQMVFRIALHYQVLWTTNVVFDFMLGLEKREATAQSKYGCDILWKISSQKSLSATILAAEYQRSLKITPHITIALGQAIIRSWFSRGCVELVQIDAGSKRSVLKCLRIFLCIMASLKLQRRQSNVETP